MQHENSENSRPEASHRREWASCCLCCTRGWLAPGCEVTVANRKAIGKKLRFEVFKRDSFTCQYCGSKAPAVILHVDHITPVASGGSNDILNLITSCAECNSGKGARELSNHAAVSCSMKQAEELQKRCEQIKMIAQWQKGLRDLESMQYKEACDYFTSLVPGWTIGGNRRDPELLQHITKHGLAEVMSCMRGAAAEHLRTGEDGKVPFESVDIIQRVFMNRLKYRDDNISDPVGSSARYAAGIARNRLRWVPVNHRQLFIDWARSGVPSEVLRDLALSSKNWTGLEMDVDAWIEEHNNAG